jgi:hypothetical protein
VIVGHLVSRRKRPVLERCRNAVLSELRDDG